MGGAGWQTEQPRCQIPNDGTDKSSKDHRSGHQVIVDDTARDRLGDLSRQARANDVEHSRDDDGHLGLECPGCHRRCHSVGWSRGSR